MPVFPGARETFLGRLERITEDIAPTRTVVSSLPESELATSLPVVTQPNPERGQLSSLLLGWEALKPEPAWVMVCLVDHPYIQAETVERLAAATALHPEAWMWSLSHQQRGGHPVIFSAEMLPLLKETPLHLGARPVVKGLGARRRWVNTEDEAVLWDVDTPEDYKKYSCAFQARTDGSC
jgi:CTP:molybdopterin cytidylyltransferase MocA